MTHWRMVMGLALLVGGAVGVGLVITNSTAGSAIVSTLVLPGDARAVALDERTKHTFVVDDPSQGTGATPGRVYVLDTRTGTVLHTVTVGRTPDFALVDERTGRVFVLNYGSGTVSVLNADSGTVVRTTRVALGPNAAGVDEQTGRVFVSRFSPNGLDDLVPNGVNGVVQVLDARSGRLLASVPVGAYPGVFAVDERTGHVVIVFSNVSTRMLDATSGRLLRIIPASGIGCALGVSVNGPTSHVFIPMLMAIGVIDTRRRLST
jgi:DNA-binding beta-propeller fold protein YncE